MDNKISNVAVYDTHTDAEQAVRTLAHAGFAMKTIGPFHQLWACVMNFRLFPIAGAVLVLFSQLPLAAQAQAPEPAGKPPAEWIQYDDLSVSPVVDDVSRALAAARRALAARDNTKAADALHDAARALQAQADRAATQDRTQAAADTKAARDVQIRMAELAGQIDDTAAQVRAGRLASTAELDRTLGKVQRADLDRRWVLTDVETWYPLTQEPQRHFTAALADYASKKYQTAASEMRQASAYLRLEAARAHGDARAALDGAEAQLGRTATALDRGTIRTEGDLTAAFARADHALAVAHRARAAESWTRKAYGQAGYELKAAAQGLENAATWTGDEARMATAAATADARAVGDKLATGAHWTRAEFDKGLAALHAGLARLGQGGTTRAIPATGQPQ
ncbi:hypothetical protein [Pseudorhodoferax sp. Leaf274]|uniref:hypothetical protein n=1 Tax=Pseudorhodoferax sp. Leaf274 TaxID=1736318 RepID=UPI0007035792|nr:hypothetical protein [Pseudorhodoferax sp. Leaf274]KQP39898.1 hypothetical protein ASF44_09300 [Pseudorhodoferax sp. Leaf274]